MKTMWKFSVSFLLIVLLALRTSGQSTATTTGGTATGSGGSVTYTAGQTAFSILSGTNGFIVQGVQQPYEISVVTSIENTEEISLAYSVYPNPTGGIIKLVIKSFGDGNFSYQLYSLTGAIIMDGKVFGEETQISMESCFSATYFLRIMRDGHEVKVFKIVKK